MSCCRSGEADRVTFLLDRGACPVAGTRSPTWRTGRPADHEAWRWTAAARGRGAVGRRPLRSGRHRRCWPRRRRWCAARRCASDAGSCSRWRSTRPATRPRHCAPSASSRPVSLSQLGIDPGPDVLALEQAILRQEPSLLSGAPVGAAGPVSVAGPDPYEVDDADRFFGRDHDVTPVWTLRDTSFLALVGPSGSGKSSLLRAGVAAALAREGQRRDHPGTASARRHSPRSTAPPTGAVVDQLEEVFTLCGDPEERQEFLGRVVARPARAGAGRGAGRPAG